MPAFILRTPDHDADPYDRARCAHLGDVGLAGYCVGIVVDANAEEHYALLKYDQGESDYWPDWRCVAPHEIPGLPVYVKD